MILTRELVNIKLYLGMHVIVSIHIVASNINAVLGGPMESPIMSNSHVSYTASNGHTCYPCSPGHYKVADCVSDGEQARCAPCSAGTFQPHCNIATTCAPCTTFCRSSRQVIVARCSRVADSECRCRHGYVWHSHGSGSQEGVCLVHSCQPGYGRKAGTTSVCSQCIPGVSYSTTLSSEGCRNCTVCDSYIKTCSPESDAVCSPHSTRSIVVPPQIIREKGSDPNHTACGRVCQLIVVGIIVAVVVAAACILVNRCNMCPDLPWKARDNRHHPNQLLNNQTDKTEPSSERYDKKESEVDPDTDMDSLLLENNNSIKPSSSVQHSQETDAGDTTTTHIRHPSADTSRQVWV